MIVLFVLCISGSAPITNGTATVTLNGLDCDVSYTFIAGGTLNGDLVGPRSSYENIYPSCFQTQESQATDGGGNHS